MIKRKPSIMAYLIDVLNGHISRIKSKYTSSEQKKELLVELPGLLRVAKEYGKYWK